MDKNSPGMKSRGKLLNKFLSCLVACSCEMLTHLPLATSALARQSNDHDDFDNRVSKVQGIRGYLLWMRASSTMSWRDLLQTLLVSLCY